MKSWYHHVRLPNTEQEFDELVDRVVKKFNFKNRDRAASVISVAIRHLERDQAYTTLEYLGNSVVKDIANEVANYKSNMLSHKYQVAHLKGILANNPNDNQARDELQKAADQGSTLAKEALDELFPPPAPLPFKATLVEAHDEPQGTPETVVSEA